MSAFWMSKVPWSVRVWWKEEKLPQATFWSQCKTPQTARICPFESFKTFFIIIWYWYWTESLIILLKLIYRICYCHSSLFWLFLNLPMYSEMKLYRLCYKFPFALMRLNQMEERDPFGEFCMNFTSQINLTIFSK